MVRITNLSFVKVLSLHFCTSLRNADSEQFLNFGAECAEAMYPSGEVRVAVKLVGLPKLRKALVAATLRREDLMRVYRMVAASAGAKTNFLAAMSLELSELEVSGSSAPDVGKVRTPRAFLLAAAASGLLVKLFGAQCPEVVV